LQFKFYFALCFHKLCASLSEKLNAKMTHQRLGDEISRLAHSIGNSG
jgi:hypothetical protein